MPYSCNLYSSSIHYAVLTEGDIVVKRLLGLSSSMLFKDVPWSQGKGHAMVT